MPLRDHFRPPVSKRSSWEGFHGGWPAMIVHKLVDQLPNQYVAEPRVQLGDYCEIDACTTEPYEGIEPIMVPSRKSDGGATSSTEAPPAPMMTFDAAFPPRYVYEVLVFDVERERKLIAAVEIVSPANKDRPESRQAFVTKCYNLLRKDVCVSIIDLVTIRDFNLYAELLALFKRTDPVFSPSPPPTYAVTCRKRDVGRKTKVDTWSLPLAVGKPLPSLPVWLSETQTVTLDLEASYEETCKVLRIG